ncbi:MAG: hypothetical protein Q7S40_04100 [Opitutaceae bacterium]|nr:hypothetical protein [Opitutaceae bacterium]
MQPGTAFVVTPPRRDPGAESSLLYAETARLVKGALMAKGLYEAPDSAHARVIVEVEYTMETPRVSRAAPDPTGQPGAAARGMEIPDEALNARSAQRGPLEKNLILTAREARPAGGGVPRTLWSVEVSTTDNSNDLRKYLPILAASAIDHMGTDSDGPKTIRISETDKSVTLIRQSK